jgi:hypothetical protein
MTTATPTRERAKDRDFSTSTQEQIDIANYINAHSGLDPISSFQLKAILKLRTDWLKSPERQAAKQKVLAERNAAKVKKAEAEARYASLTPEQRTAVKKAEKAAARAAKLKEEAAKLFG